MKSARQLVIFIVRLLFALDPVIALNMRKSRKASNFKSCRHVSILKHTGGTALDRSRFFRFMFSIIIVGNFAVRMKLIQETQFRTHLRARIL